MAGTIFNDGKFQGIGNDGLVSGLGTLKFTFASSGLDAITYQDSLLTVANTNPIILTSSGKANVFLINGVYNIVLKDKDDVVIWSIEDFTIDSQGIGAQVLQNTADILANRAYNNRSVYEQYDEFTATGGETELLTINNTNLEIYINYVPNLPPLVLGTDYTVDIDGVTINLTSPLTNGDVARWYRLDKLNGQLDPLRRQDLSTVLNVLSDANYTLTDIENQYGRIEITDSGVLLTATREIIMNNDEHTFLFVNSTAQSLTVKTSAGTGITVIAGASVELRNDTVNVIAYEAGITLLGALDTANFIHVQDQKTTGTSGGTSSAGVNTRVLNTVLANSIIGASLSANQITLPIGTYYIEANAGVIDSDSHRVSLKNATDVSIEILGSSEYNTSASVDQTRSFIKGKFTIAAIKAFEIEHQITSPRVTNGFGIPISDGNAEVYTDVIIWKVG